MNFGISEKSMKSIVDTISKWVVIEEAAIFGSRALGNFKNGSDIDLVVYGIQVTEDIVSHLSVILNEELPLPYYFDIIHYESIKNEQLKEHIDTEGIVFFDRKLKNNSV